tara:strand:+ start:115066 stop:115266 length:201 start_codon:yes stop_codon:yes gene_type:complete
MGKKTQNMSAKINKRFKAVDYMRQVRAELSDLYQADKDRFHKELDQSMADFLAAGKKRSLQRKIAE